MRHADAASASQLAHRPRAAARSPAHTVYAQKQHMPHTMSWHGRPPARWAAQPPPCCAALHLTTAVQCPGTAITLCLRSALLCCAPPACALLPRLACAMPCSAALHQPARCYHALPAQCTAVPLRVRLEPRASLFSHQPWAPMLCNGPGAAAGLLLPKQAAARPHPEAAALQLRSLKSLRQHARSCRTARMACSGSTQEAAALPGWLAQAARKPLAPSACRTARPPNLLMQRTARPRVPGQPPQHAQAAPG